MDVGGNRSLSRSWCRWASGISYDQVSDHICCEQKLKAWREGMAVDSTFLCDSSSAQGNPLFSFVGGIKL
jgi:hypothetical protein